MLVGTFAFFPPKYFAFLNATRHSLLPAWCQQRAQALKLHGLLAHWSEIATSDWLEPLIDWEENERARRSFERRLSAALSKN